MKRNREEKHNREKKEKREKIQRNEAIYKHFSSWPRKKNFLSYDLISSRVNLNFSFGFRSGLAVGLWICPYISFFRKIFITREWEWRTNKHEKWKFEREKWTEFEIKREKFDSCRREFAIKKHELRKNTFASLFSLTYRLQLSSFSALSFSRVERWGWQQKRGRNGKSLVKKVLLLFQNTTKQTTQQFQGSALLRHAVAHAKTVKTSVFGFSLEHFKLSLSRIFLHFGNIFISISQSQIHANAKPKSLKFPWNPFRQKSTDSVSGFRTRLSATYNPLNTGNET